ncbi:DUF2764 family protein [Draconibacterium sp. IB214405]|uniref:DUF2764 family protein n=1 Tax=Draconibacterium sp. IB214405 TaxID=3097352 RepID=UPI002A0F450C|nr:DUF2764 family protein [Draconibacterium sp. IB214405]MDX8339588.1 DUF2764 family protein [Draconibacterium sp. IB214405]
MVYLMTSLPSLSFDQAPPISINEFNDEAKKQLSSRHFKLLQSTDIQKLETNVGVKSISSLLKDIKEDLSEVRKAKVQNRQAKTERLPNAALRGNPLERELNIMRWQWQELQDIEAGKTFSLTEVLVYKLKLQLVTRAFSFDEKQGAKVLASVVNPGKNKEDK